MMSMVRSMLMSMVVVVVVVVRSMRMRMPHVDAREVAVVVVVAHVVEGAVIGGSGRLALDGVAEVGHGR